MMNEIIEFLTYISLYLYTIVIILITAILKEILECMSNNKRIYTSKIIIPSIIIGIILASVFDVYKVNQSIYILACVLSGMWNKIIWTIITNNKIAIKIISIFTKHIDPDIGNIIDNEDDDKLKKK
mgnify:CR=1 FL=1